MAFVSNYCLLVTLKTMHRSFNHFSVQMANALLTSTLHTLHTSVKCFHYFQTFIVTNKPSFYNFTMQHTQNPLKYYTHSCSWRLSKCKVIFPTKELCVVKTPDHVGRFFGIESLLNCSETFGNMNGQTKDLYIATKLFGLENT